MYSGPTNPLLFSEKLNVAAPNSKFSIVTSSMMSWIDLPPAPFQTIKQYSALDFCELEQIINQYHELDKTKYEFLSERISKLDGISLLIQNKIQSFEKYERSLLESLSNIASMKSRYLKLIQLFYAHHDDSFDSIRSFFLPHGNELFPMKNSIGFEPATNFFYGRFWIEAIDPCHRELAMLRIQWEAIKDPKPLFFLWLEEKLAYVSQIRSLRYFTVEEREQRFRCCVRGGLIHIRDETLSYQLAHCDIEKKGFIFTQLENKALYLLKPDEPNTRHSSISLGQPVAAAGIIWANEGMVSKIFFMSGHYAPTEDECNLMLTSLMGTGITIQNNVVIQYYVNNQIMTDSLDQFCSKKRMVNS